MKKPTLVLGASPKSERYSYQAIMRLQQAQHPVFAVGLRQVDVLGLTIFTDLSHVENPHTITLYLQPQNQIVWYEKILALHPKRIIFNPGTENPQLREMAEKAGIETVDACTLVLLATEQY
jgi:uncharacterized protein